MTKGELYMKIDKIKEEISNEHCNLVLECKEDCFNCPLNYQDDPECVIDSINDLLGRIHKEARNDYQRDCSKT